MEPIHFYRSLTHTLTVPLRKVRVYPTTQLVSGFTLVEIMVVFAIIVTITGVVFTSQSTFNKTLILANTAYDVALTLRSAETYGLSSRVISGAGNAGYGIHFDTGTNTFILFEDSSGSSCHTSLSGYSSGPDAQPGNCVYDSSAEDVKKYTLGNNITVTGLYAGGVQVTSLDIVFARPNPDPFIRANKDVVTKYNSACVTLTSPSSSGTFTRSVKIVLSGQITSNATTCP